MISGMFAVVSSRYRRENTAQHAANQVRLGAIATDVSEISKDVRSVREWQHRHLEWHAEQKV
jgi:hypothetical protein